MEVSGKRAEVSLSTSVRTSSAEAFDFYCDPCDHDGDHVEAKFYCKNCQEFLCIPCAKSHRKVTLSRNHILLEGDKMPTSQRPSKSPPECSEPCPQHTQEVIIYYCRAHDEVGCHECMADRHSVCRNEFIPDILKHARNEEACKKFVKDLDDFKEQAEQYKIKGQENKGKIDSHYDTAIKQMKSFRNDVISCLDQMESSLTSEAMIIKQTQQTEMDRIISECDRVSRETEQLKDEVTKGEKIKTFVLMKLNKDKIRSCKSALGTFENVNDINTFTFKPNETVVTLQSGQGFGQLVIKTDMKATVQRNPFDILAKASAPVNVKSDTDKGGCESKGIAVVSADEIAVADISKRSVKFINVKEQKVISQQTLPTGPWDVTMVTSKTLAVTLPYSKKVQMITKSDGWHIDDYFLVKGACYGIAKCSDNNTAIALEMPPRVDIVTRTGVVLKTFQSDSDEKNIFRNPKYVAVDPAEKYVYVSDVGTKSVIKISQATGEIIATYQSVGKSPYGVAVTENGTVLVCDLVKSNSNVYMMSNDLSSCEALLGKQDGLISPQAIYYCRRQKKVYIACFDNAVRNSIFTFTVHHK